MNDRQLDQDLKILATFLDSKFKGPFGFRFGWDGILGLIPGVGDLLTSLLSSYIVLRCSMKNYPKTVILRMALNVLIESLVGLIPLVGNLFDSYWKANLKNIALAERYEKGGVQVHTESKLMVGLYFVIFFTLLATVLALPLLLIVWALNLVL